VFLYRDLRRLTRVDRPVRVRATSSAEFVSHLEPAERALRFRRRLFLLALFLLSCIYAIVGVWMVRDAELFGFVTAAFFGFCAFKWGMIAMLPPESVSEMPASFFHFVPPDDPWQKADSAEIRDRGNRARVKSEYSTADSELWDRELDGRT
jgi:hypothetical protein